MQPARCEPSGAARLLHTMHPIIQPAQAAGPCAANRPTAGDVKGRVRPFVAHAVAIATLLFAPPAIIQSFAQSIVWTRAVNDFANGDATPGCSLAATPNKSVALDADGDVIATGCAGANPAQMITTKWSGAMGQVLWSTTTTGTGRGEGALGSGTALAVDPRGDVVVVSAPFQSGSGSTSRQHIVKYDGRTGVELWQVATAARLYQLTLLAVDTAGNIAITASVAQDYPDESTRILTTRHDGMTGHVLWEATYSGPDPGDKASATGIATDAGGNVLVTGCSQEAAGGTSLRTIRYDGGTGAETWHALYRGDAAAHLDYCGAGVAVDTTGNVLIAGDIRDAGGAATHTIKYDGRTGAERWNALHIRGPEGGGIPTLLALDARDDVVVNGSGIVKYDGATGAERWRVPGDDSNGHGIAFDAGGNVFVTGISRDLYSISDIGTIKYDGATGAPLWKATYNGEKNFVDIGLGVTVDRAGDAVVAGSSRDIVGGMNFRMIKYAGDTGMALWTAIEPATPVELGLLAQRALAVDARGDALITGYDYARSGTTTEMRTAKYDGITGAEAWVVHHGGQTAGARSMGITVGVDSRGDLIAGGSRGVGSDTFEARTIKHDGHAGTVRWSVGECAGPYSTHRGLVVDRNDDIAVALTCSGLNMATADRIIKYDGGSGAQVWNVRYLDGTGGFPGAAVLAADAAGDIVVAGSYGGGVLATAKYDGRTGTEVWRATFGGGSPWGYGYAAAIAIDAHGDVVIAGLSTDGRPDGEFPGGGYQNLRTIKYDGRTGAQLWTAAFPAGTPYGTGISAVALDASGNVFVTGASVTYPAWMMRTIKYDGATGAQLWTAAYPDDGQGGGFANALMLDAAGNAIITGFVRDTAGRQSFHTVKFDGATGAQRWALVSGEAAGGPDIGIAVARAPGPALYVLGTAYESGRPQGWLLQKIQDGAITVTPTADAHGSIGPASAQDVVSGAQVRYTLTAEPGYAAVMGGTCGGMLTGAVYTTAPVLASCSVEATFFRATLDVDASNTATRYDPLTDGLIIVRYLFGLTGPALTGGTLGSTASRTDPASLKEYLDRIRPLLDIDSDGVANALTDGLLILRYLFGLRGDALITGAIAPTATRRTAPEIEAHLALLLP